MASTSGQVPQAFNYQAILRNANGTPKANESVAIQISIIHGHTVGPPVCQEAHNMRPIKTLITPEIFLHQLILYCLVQVQHVEIGHDARWINEFGESEFQVSGSFAPGGRGLDTSL